MPETDERSGTTGQTGGLEPFSHSTPEIVSSAVMEPPAGPRGHTSFRIVPKGTPGAIPLNDVIHTLREQMGMPEHTDKTKKKLAVTTRRLWKTGKFNKTTKEKISASHRKRWGRGCRQRKGY